MSGWPTVPLGDLMPSRVPSVDPAKAPDEKFTLWSIPSYDAGQPEHAFGHEIGSSKKLVQNDDVLLSKIVPHIRRAWTISVANDHRQIASSEWIIFRHEAFLSDYIRHFLLTDQFHARFMGTVAGVGGSLLRAQPKSVAKIEIPLPPLDEQGRIVALLDRAEAIRRRADTARKAARALIPALFTQTFGDPATNPKGWEVVKLGDHVMITGGATPAKARPEFWGGNIPWVSPKDMKPPIIADSADKITEAAMGASPVRLVPPDQVLIVVRGMILVHTVPIRMNSVAVTLNQDMKALSPDDRLNPVFLRWMLQVSHDYLLGKVRQSAHGTRKLETSVLTEFPAILSPLPLQTAFAAQARRIEAMAHALDAATAKAEATAAALSARLFGQASPPT